MDVFDELTGLDLRSLDPDGGVLVVTVYWRPRAKDPNPEQPGEKIFALSYLPIDASDLCRYEAGKIFYKRVNILTPTKGFNTARFVKSCQHCVSLTCLEQSGKIYLSKRF